MQIAEPQYFGQLLHRGGFEKWFLYFFEIINKEKKRNSEENAFCYEALHQDLFNVFQDIYELKSIKDIINIAPRSAKTTMCVYFVAYALAVNPYCEFIYTSISANLLQDVLQLLKRILEHPVYIACYKIQKIEIEQFETPIDIAWQEYLDEEARISKRKNNFNSYSVNLIKMPQGGKVHLIPIGSSIIGLGAGIRANPNIFGGMLINDDPNKPQDTLSQKMRSKVYEFYKSTLETRLNHSNVPTLIMQQRLHIEDLTGVILEKEQKKLNQWRITKKPLLIDGVCQLPSQYSKDKIASLQLDEYTFSAQYQQEPIQYGGNIIKKDWLITYSKSWVDLDLSYLFITVDTAVKVKEQSDYSVFSVWGKHKDGRVYLIDGIRGKFEYTRGSDGLFPNFIKLLNRFNKTLLTNKSYCFLTTVYIEDHASGSQLIQDLRNEMNKMNISSLSISPQIKRLKKAERLIPCLKELESGRVLFPENNKFANEMISECLSFTRDDSHMHDDCVDTLIDAITFQLLNTNKSSFIALYE